jgi:hypothetical protein
MTTQKATFAAGCFWSVELAYQRVPGVTKVLIHPPPSPSLLYFLQGNSVQLSSLKLPQFFFLVLLCFYLLSGRTFELRRQDFKASG